MIIYNIDKHGQTILTLPRSQSILNGSLVVKPSTKRRVALAITVVPQEPKNVKELLPRKAGLFFCGKKHRVGRLWLNVRVCQAILPRLVLDVLC